MIKNYKVRVANNSTPEECNNEDFSQTSCGFVVEFVDAIEKRVISSNASSNEGGWPASELRTYANNDFFNKFPKNLQNVIIDTKVISGHGNISGEANYISNDKIYLLSTHEIYIDGESRPVSKNDTAYNQTRQLDYYNLMGVSTDNYEYAIKYYNNDAVDWWLRSIPSYTSSSFTVVTSDGFWDSHTMTAKYNFSPAFRIG